MTEQQSSEKSIFLSAIEIESEGRKRCQEPFLDDVGPAGYLTPMGRPLRAADGDTIYHVLNRANARMTIFRHDDDFAAFAPDTLSVRRFCVIHQPEA